MSKLTGTASTIERVEAAKQVLAYFDSPRDAAEALECSYEAIKTYRKKGLPERVALLCHLSPEIPYTYNPSDYGRDPDKMRLVLTKPASIS